MVLKEFVFSKQVNPDQLMSELAAAGFKIQSINRVGDKQWLLLAEDEAKDPSAVIAAHNPTNPAAVKQALLDELASIEEAIDAGTETPLQRRRFMKIILRLNGWNRRQ